MYKKYFKRPFDFIFALLSIIILFPIFIIVAILVRVNLGSPIIFKQERPGKNEKIFTMYKFRTMIDKKDKNDNLLLDDLRLTRFGKLLRATSLDELPELFNILNGAMSFVGPRPLLVEYLSYYTKEEKYRHHVKPGLSGLAQINGRNNLSWSDRFKFDVQYVGNITFIGDMKIILMTLWKAFIKKEAVSENTRETEGNFAEIRQSLINEEENNEIISD